MARTDTATGGAVSVDVESFTPTHWAVVALAGLSGVVHLYLFTTEDYTPFLLAGAGFFGAIVLLIALSNYRRYLYPVGVLFVLAQLAGYVAMGSAFDTPMWLDAVDKVAQVVLVLLLARFTYEAWT